MLSKDGKRYIESMRGYLASYGVKESEAESLLEEAKVHLMEGEKNGKTVEDIFGKTPKKYAKELVSVLPISTKENIKHIAILLIAIFGFVIIDSLIMNTSLELSMIELLGYPLSFILWIIFFVLAFRMTSFKSETNEFILTWLYMLIPSAATIGVLFFSQQYDQTVLTIDGMPRYILGGLLAIVIVINLASLFNLKFSLIHVVSVFGSLLLFEYFRLEEMMYSELRFLVPGVISYLLWRLYGRGILLEQRSKQF